MFFPSADQPQAATATPAAIEALPFLVERLVNDLTLRFHDQTNRYFGDYHRVRIVVEIELGFDSSFLPDQDLLTAGIARFGEQLIIRKVLERMGVPGALVEEVRAKLVASYRHEIEHYLCRPEVPLRLLRAELAQKSSPSTILRLR